MAMAVSDVATAGDLPWASRRGSVFGGEMQTARDTTRRRGNVDRSPLSSSGASHSARPRRARCPPCLNFNLQGPVDKADDGPR